MPAAFIDHLVFRVSDLEVSGCFYAVLLEQEPEPAGGSLLYRVGETLLFLTSAALTDAPPYNKDHVGLNHIALGVRSLGDLRLIEERLDLAHIGHSGIRIDRHGQKEYIWLDDPDGFRVEFYLRPL